MFSVQYTDGTYVRVLHDMDDTIFYIKCSVYQNLVNIGPLVIDDLYVASDVVLRDNVVLQNSVPLDVLLSLGLTTYKVNYT